MEYEFRDGKVLVKRTAEERGPVVARLRRIEGQVRGLIQMVEADRYCLDEVQQANAISSAMREVALMILTSHMEAGLALALEGERGQAVLAEVSAVLRSALRL